MKKWSDELILVLYRFWSEERYSASFLHPDPSAVRQFREWLTTLPGPAEDYEREMLAEYAHQEEASHDD